MSKLARRLLPTLLGLLGFLSSSCVTVQDATTCAVAGRLSGGGLCAHMLSDSTFLLSFAEMLDFLEAHQERTCVPVPGLNVCAQDQSHGAPAKLPARGAAIVMSAEDWGEKKTELEIACRELGKRCSYAMQKAIDHLPGPQP